jgi:hypothetical protein
VTFRHAVWQSPLGTATVAVDSLVAACGVAVDAAGRLLLALELPLTLTVLSALTVETAATVLATVPPQFLAHLLGTWVRARFTLTLRNPWLS